MKNRLTLYTLFLFLVALLSGCAGTTPTTKGSAFPKMYEEQPRSILILPPMNESSDAEAKSYYMTTVEVPFAQMGYYVFPVEMVSDIMKQEGVYDTELLYNMPLDKFYEYFGADAVLFTKIKQWKVSYAVIASSLTVSIEAVLKSTKTNQELWRYYDTIVVDLSGGNSGGGIGGLIASAIATAINTAAADYVTYARVANSHIVFALPAGPYSPLYMQDQSIQITDKRAKEK
ncbi:GNA1162 family protein [Sulfurimonas paralvinellae]|uniref:Lipoprotein n=1 Tax=Sulfurimonas paralvinellae TaxID=317658 RepID=A0A7M1BA17_9BACT|nr:GNA1162 family protein [Sulfurimonas paralvinellae]QOP46495.1 hypothetical protein FM071_09390 [Sulfurimonas paralvinellae]